MLSVIFPLYVVFVTREYALQFQVLTGLAMNGVLVEHVLRAQLACPD